MFEYEKEKLRGQSDAVVTSDSEMVTLLVDLDDTDTVQNAERNAGIALARVIVVQAGRKCVSFLHLVAVGFELGSRGINLETYVAKAQKPEEHKINIRMERDGHPLEPDPKGFVMSDRGPHTRLRAEVRAAINAYDVTSDHKTHAAGSDCVRCALEAALTGEKPKGFQKGRR